MFISFFSRLSVGLFICWAVSACTSPPQEIQSYRKSGTYPYPADLKSPASWVVLERNGRLEGYGSGFFVILENGQTGHFTNKHVSNMFNSLGRGSQKMFFNGRVFNVDVDKTPILADAALINITDDFDSSDFPEPYKISSEPIKIGDKIIIEGFHIHPYHIRKADEDDGYKFPVIPVLKEYYRLPTMNLEREREMVFEKLEGEVNRLDVTMTELLEKCGNSSRTSSFIQNIRNDTNLYAEVKINRDHRFSFGGLSGSAAKNKRNENEVVGILTLQDVCRVEWYEQPGAGFKLGEQVFDTIYLTPISSAPGSGN